MTQEEITRSVNAAYDSVHLINALKSKPSLTEDETDTLARNKEHIGIMLAKTWFSGALSPDQAAEMQAAMA